MASKTKQYRAMYEDQNGNWLPATAPGTWDEAEREVERLKKSGLNAMVESVASSARLARKRL